MPGERNPQSAAEEFAPPPQGESVLDASMMAELIVTKRRSRLSTKSPPELRGPGRKAPARLVNDCRYREGMGPSIRFFGSAVRGRFSRGGSQPLVGRHLKGRSGRTWRCGHESCKAIRKISDMATLVLDKKLAAAMRVLPQDARPIANLKSPRRQKPTRACPANTRWAGELRRWRSRVSLRQTGNP